MFYRPGDRWPSVGSALSEKRGEGKLSVTGAADGPIKRLPATLVLWDVDHTLIENGGVSKETYALAFELLVGHSPSVRPVTEGRTDFRIMRELLEANGIDADGFVEIGQFEEVLTEAMKRKAPEFPQRGYVLPGVVDALAALSEVPVVVQSMLTGNIKPNAIAKIGAFGLEKWVDADVGGYGSDDKVRSNWLMLRAGKFLRSTEGISTNGQPS